MPDDDTRYLDPTDAAVVRLLGRGISGPVTMLNLLRLRDVADYGDFPELTPTAPISGEAAYMKAQDKKMFEQYKPEELVA